MAIAAFELGNLRALAVVAFAELTLDRGHLLAQQHLAVARVECRLGLAADLRGKAEHLDAVGEQPRDAVEPRRDVDGLQYLLLLVGGRVHVGRDHVGERGRRLDALNGGQKLGRGLGQKLHGLHRLSLEVDEARLDVGRNRRRLGNAQHARDEERPAGQEFDDLEALLALADEMVRAVRRRDVARDIGDRTHAMHVDRKGIGRFGIPLHQDADRPLFPHRLLRGRDRARTPDRDRKHHAGKQHGIAHGHDDERIVRQRRQMHRAALAGVRCRCLGRTERRERIGLTGLGPACLESLGPEFAGPRFDRQPRAGPAFCKVITRQPLHAERWMAL